MDAVEGALKHIAREKEKGADIPLVSFPRFTDWLARSAPRCWTGGAPWTSAPPRPAAGTATSGRLPRPPELAVSLP
ncbi:hypothetical protein SFUMM280S_03260 [Streptomyces fumanus]